jgi:hypothetical protein
LAEKAKNKKTKGGNGEDKELKDQLGEMKGSSSETEKAGGSLEDEVKRKEQEEMIKKLQEEIDKLTTKDIIVQMMMSLSSLAYKKMGIPIGVNDRYKDKMQAKLAVDCFDALLKIVSDEVSGQENENLKSSLSNLQINFVKAFI